MCFLGKEVFLCEFESESSRGHVCIVIPETFFVFKKMTSGICTSFLGRQVRREWGCDGCVRTPPQATDVHSFVDQRFGRLEIGTLLKDHNDQHC